MSALDLDAIEARAKRDVVACDECDAPATRVCNATECSATRCDAHAVAHSGHCDHRWYPRRSGAAEAIALVAEVRVLRSTLALAQESLAAAVRDERVTVVDEVVRLTRERDEARADAAALRAVAREYLTLRDAVAAHDTSSRPFTDYATFVLAIDKLTAAHDALRAAIGGAS